MCFMPWVRETDPAERQLRRCAQLHAPHWQKVRETDPAERQLRQPAGRYSPRLVRKLEKQTQPKGN